VKSVTWILCAALVLLVAVEWLFAPHHQPVFPWHGVAGYMAAIGLGSCLGVVVLSKCMGRLFLQRAEDRDDR